MKILKLKLNQFKLENGIILIFLLLLLPCLQLYSQTIPEEKQEMRLIGELPGHVDVKFRVVKCENANKDQVFLWLHNESERYGEPSDVASNFEIVILNYETGKSFKKNISIATSVDEIVTADCENDSPLKIDLPPSYPPSSIAAYLINTGI